MSADINRLPIKTLATEATLEKSVLLYLQVLETKGDVDGLDELCAWVLCELCGNRSSGSCCCRTNSGEEVVDAPSKEKNSCNSRAGACRVCGAPCVEGVVSSVCFRGRRGRPGRFSVLALVVLVRTLLLLSFSVSCSPPR